MLPTTRPSPLIRLIVTLAMLSLAVAALTLMGRGPLGVPSVLQPSAWGPWLAARDAVTMVFAVLRLLTLMLAWYLLGTTVIGIAARALRSARLVAAADVLAVPAVRRLLQSALGVGFATAALTAGSGASPAPPPAAVAAASLPAHDTIAMSPAATDAVTMLPIDQQLPADDEAQRSEAHHDDADRTWTVEPGDHFWSIAERVLRRAWGRSPSEEETAMYWERLVAANRRDLVDSGNADLIVPGQQFRLPPVPNRRR